VLSFFHILRVIVACINPLDCRGNYSATSNNMKLVHWPLMGELLHLAQRGGNWAGPQPVRAGSIAKINEVKDLALKGGATVLKVGGDNFASGASKKNFLTPHFLASGGTKCCLVSLIPLFDL